MNKNKFELQKFELKKTGTIIAIIIGIIGIGLRVWRVQARQERRESQNAAISKAQSVQSAIAKINTTDPAKDAAAKNAMSMLQSLAQNSKTSSNSESIKYDKYTPVDGTFSLGQIGNKFYVVDPKTQQQTPLDNVTEAYVVEINNKDKNNIFGAIVGKIGNEWFVYVNEAKNSGSLGDLNITSKTRKVTIQKGNATVE